MKCVNHYKLQIYPNLHQVRKSGIYRDSELLDGDDERATDKVGNIQQIQSQEQLSEQGKPGEYRTRDLKPKIDTKYPAPKARKRDVAKTTEN